MSPLLRPRARVLAGLLTLVFCSTQAAAGGYGAIAFSQSSGAHGYSFGYDTRGGAEREALQGCGGGCTVVLRFSNACGALAVGANNGYGTGWASSRGQAEHIAMSNCNQNSTNCSILQWACSHD
jgi:hypothetical protein